MEPIVKYGTMYNICILQQLLIEKYRELQQTMATDLAGTVGGSFS
jgi:hypothetical protein